jgi:hypothetical protein
MSSARKNDKTRRAFFGEVSATAAGVAVAMAQLRVPVIAAPQEAKSPAPNRASKNKDRKYGIHFLTEPELRNKPRIPMPNPAAYVDSASHFGSQTCFSMGWRYIKEPMLFDRIPHSHPFDEFLCFLGGNLENMFDFDATIELSMGEEEELYVIEQPTVVHIPAGFVHTPLTFKRIDKPVLFQPIPLTPDYYSNSSKNIKLFKK